MENTTINAGGFSLSKTRILRIAALIIFTYVICRSSMMGGFPVAISLISYMVSRKTSNIYLLLPAAAGMLPYIAKGHDPWGDFATMCVCGLLFAAARRMKPALWHTAVIAGAVSIVCMSIYRLATATVYKTGVEMLLMESLVVFIMVFVFDAFFSALESAGSFQEGNGSLCSNNMTYTELQPISFAVICLIVLNGMGLSSFIWMMIIFLVIWFLIYVDTGTSLLVTAACSAAAALMDQGQWGLMATLMIGISAATFARKSSAVLTVAVFAAVCWALKYVENGVVLGVNEYYLFVSSAVFLALRWKFGASMGNPLYIFCAKAQTHVNAAQSYEERILSEKIEELEALTELYSTYLDSRSVLACQFSIAEQILQDAAFKLSRQGRRTVRHAHEKFDIDVAISQCAAAGAINGDCCGWQDIGDGKVAMVVSDGMGKGKRAAAESLMVTKTIISLLKSGATVDMTLKMINTIMLMKEDEDFYATVDLAVIDKKTAKARFYKIGAAPTLIRRKHNVEEVKLSAVPLGIVNGLKIRYVETTLKKDDWIIMMSDGVSDGGQNLSGSSRSFLNHLREAAADVRSQDPRTMSDLLLNHAADSYIGRERDDMTVMVAKMI